MCPPPGADVSYPYTMQPPTGPNLGLIVLQSDETIEMDMRRLLSPQTPLYISRVPSAPEVTPQTLRDMAGHITQSAELLPTGMAFASLGYGCTSGTSQIGARRVADLVRAGAQTAQVTDPVSALLAACAALGITRLGLLSPYIASVSGHLRDILAASNVQTPNFGSFDEAQEARVVRIDTASIVSAARDIARQGPMDALFLSCTNLRTLEAIPILEADLGVPVLSSNLVLAWHMARQGGAALAPYPARLFAA